MSKEQEINQKIEALKLAMIENIEASRAETEAAIRRRKAHYALQMARKAVDSIEYEDYQPNTIPNEKPTSQNEAGQ